ncbi:MAG: TetR/AcrR family transcriptional regulator [Bacillota bacterium]
MDKNSGMDARERIIKAATQLFSQKGYDATRVSDIATAADVNKALIYYYFKSKEDILDYMVHSLLNNAVSITMDFIQTNIVQMATHKRTIGRSRSSTQSHQVLSSKELLFWILIAESIIDESDVICVVVKNDSIQETRFHFSFCKRHSRLSDGPHQGS